jgi:ornithine cyclodeaminase/alanine dehydrogenase-like protein (mu-crystallin family)
MLRIVELPEILAALDEAAALDAVESGFRRLHAFEAQVTTVGHLTFADPYGDCHIKSGYIAGDEVFVIKVASGFHGNPALGLPSSNGFMAVMSARTGEVLGILRDQGRLTDLRTALAGAIAARAIHRPGSNILGIVGAGTQARLQARMIARHLKVTTVLVWARNPDAATALATEIGGTAVSLCELCARSELIVTTTPSTEPLLTSDMIGAGKRIIAVGADAPGKRELDPTILARARVVVDSCAQCIDHGETGWAVRAGLIDAASLIELGALLTAPIAFADAEIVVADLTGVAVQDVAIAKSVWSRLTQGPP